MSVKTEIAKPMKALSIIAEVSDIRLDKYLAEEIELISRSRIKDSIISKDVLVNGEAVKPSFKLAGGETIQVEIPDPQQNSPSREILQWIPVTPFAQQMTDLVHQWSVGSLVVG